MSNMSHNAFRRWMTWSIGSLVIVALLGTLMRYKIAFSFPFVDQKHLLHAHSHFAFCGWVSQTLFLLMVHALSQVLSRQRLKQYHALLLLNLFSAYGMLAAFILQGYSVVSISFSVLSIVAAYLFALLFWKDLRLLPKTHPSKPWWKAALLFNAFSTLGTFYLAHLMTSRSVDQDQYLASVYYYLHFQYNGWFLFAAAGLFFHWLNERTGIVLVSPWVYRLLVWSCVPAFLLSVLWAKLPTIVYVLAIVAAVVQVVAWAIAAKQFGKVYFEMKRSMHRISLAMLVMAAFAFTIKVGLQLGSTVPYISKLAFGFRPIVIAYLHLILLGIFSMFLPGYAYQMGLLRASATTRGALVLFIAGVLLNEVILLIQGVASFSYLPVPYVNEALLIAATIMLTGAIAIWYAQRKKEFI